MDYLSVADRSWPVLRRAFDVHRFVYEASDGRIGRRIPGLRAPMLLIDHVGAKSGVKRTTPLLYVDDPPNVVLVASKGGYSKNPAWYHNLVANPETTARIGRERRPVRARVATPEERERLWPMAVRTYRPYADYQRRTGREIPLVILERRAAT